MFRSRPLFTNLAVAIFSVYFSMLWTETGSRIVHVHDPKLDIALLYDQSNSMKDYLNSTIWKDFKIWIDHYCATFEEATKTQFAVMGCGFAVTSE